jgi:hypothetical protein
MNSTKSLLLLALVGCALVNGAAIKKNLVQSSQAVAPSATLVSTAAAVEADTSSGTQVISDLQCENSADTTESDSEAGVEATVGCEAAKRLYLFGGTFDYFDTVNTSDSVAKNSVASASVASYATASSSL